MTLRIAQKQNEFNRLTKAFSELYHDICVQIGISDSVFDIFYAITALGDGCCQKDICNYAFTSKQTIHSSIHKLVKENLIYLESGKGREQHIFLTPQGEQFIKEKIAPVVIMENQACSLMKPEELDSLLELTEKYFECLSIQKNNLTLQKERTAPNET